MKATDEYVSARLSEVDSDLQKLFEAASNGMTSAQIISKLIAEEEEDKIVAENIREEQYEHDPADYGENGPPLKYDSDCEDDNYVIDSSNNNYDEIGKRLRMLVAGLTRRKAEEESRPINACKDATENSEKWVKLSITMDSGASESVIDPNQLRSHECKETEESRNGEGFASATDEPIAHLGELKFLMLTREGTTLGMTMQGAPVTNPLGSVKRTCQAGHVVVFDDDGSFIMNKRTGEINVLRECNGNYLLDVMVPPPKEVERLAQSFCWQAP